MGVRILDYEGVVGLGGVGGKVSLVVFSTGWGNVGGIGWEKVGLGGGGGGWMLMRGVGVGSVRVCS